MKKKEILFAVVILTSVLFVQCSKDDENGVQEKGTLNVKITDAPSDDSNIEGTFITVADIKVNGKSVDGFTKQTIEISAYQEGNAKLIFSDEVNADTYDSVSLVLDYETDASGNAPGCYILTDDNKKHDLTASASSNSEINIAKSFSVQNNAETSLVVDFDLRRAIVRFSESAESEFRFVSEAELQSAVRIANEEMTGEIFGEVNSTLDPGDETYVFVYHKGSFNLLTESQGQGSSGVLFANAVTSTKVNNDNTYHLAFLEEGNYEIHVASFSKVSEFKTSFQGMLNASSTISGLFLSNITVHSNTELELNIEANGTI